MNFNNIDANVRNNPLLHDVGIIHNEKIKRITAIAIPFLNLYRPTAVLVTVGMGVVKVYTHLKIMVVFGKKGDWLLSGKELMKLALTVGSVALSILRPTVGVIISHTLQLAIDIHHLVRSLRKGEFKEASLVLLSIAHTAIHIASVFYVSPELILISLVAQAALELYRSAHEFYKGNYLEGIANLAMALIRCHQAHPHLKTVHRNWFGRSLTQDQFQAFMVEFLRFGERATNGRLSSTGNLEAFLEKNGISSWIKNISFSGKNLSHIQISNVSMTNCDFTGAKIDSSLIANVKFDNCVFNEARVTNSLVLNSSFFRSSFIETEWNHSVFSQVHWKKCDLSHSYFNDATLSKVTFEASKLFETCFLGANAIASKIIDCDLTDCLLLRTKKMFQIQGGKPHHITRPIVGLLWNFETNGAFADIVKKNVMNDYKGIVLKFEYLPKDIDTAKLDGEVKEVLDFIKDQPDNEISIAEAILKYAKPGSEIEKIKMRAEEALESVDAIVLPGGLDIHPELYGHSKESQTHHDDDYRRPILEFAAIDQAKKKQIFTLGICRGSQIVNVFHGGALKQHEEGQSGAYQELMIEKELTGKPLEIVQTIVGSGLRGLSMHHQASQKIGKGLKRVIHYQGVTKAMISEDGQFVLTQFHPEIYPYLVKSESEMVAKNRGFFDYLMKRAWEHKLQMRREEAV